MLADPADSFESDEEERDVQGGRLALGPFSSLRTRNGLRFGPLFRRNGPLWEVSGGSKIRRGTVAGP